MQITVKLFANFRHGRFTTSIQEFPVGTRVAEVSHFLQIQDGEIGTIMLNNQHADPGRPLQDGDRLAFFPLIGGG
jgi:DNA phosphorothioation-dependent restriction protein DptG